MTKDDVITIMMNSINDDNRQLCVENGMSEEEIEKNINASQLSLGFIMSNIYDKLVEKGIIAAEG
jgi:hypothetical protein